MVDFKIIINVTNIIKSLTDNTKQVILYSDKATITWGGFQRHHLHFLRSQRHQQNWTQCLPACLTTQSGLETKIRKPHTFQNRSNFHISTSFSHYERCMEIVHFQWMQKFGCKRTTHLLAQVTEEYQHNHGECTDGTSSTQTPARLGHGNCWNSMRKFRCW